MRLHPTLLIPFNKKHRLIESTFAAHRKLGQFIYKKLFVKFVIQPAQFRGLNKKFNMMYDMRCLNKILFTRECFISSGQNLMSDAFKHHPALILTRPIETTSFRCIRKHCWLLTVLFWQVGTAFETKNYIVRRNSQLILNELVWNVMMSIHNNLFIDMLTKFFCIGRQTI